MPCAPESRFLVHLSRVFDANVCKGSAIPTRLWEIAENLHRAELTKLQHDEQVAEWIRLRNEKENVQSAGLRPNESKREDGRGHRPEGGINAVAREFGIKRTSAQESVKVDSLSDEAKDAAREHGASGRPLTQLVRMQDNRRRNVWGLASQMRPRVNAGG
jgi:hypothetical protein